MFFNICARDAAEVQKQSESKGRASSKASEFKANCFRMGRNYGCFCVSANPSSGAFNQFAAGGPIDQHQSPQISRASPGCRTNFSCYW